LDSIDFDAALTMVPVEWQIAELINPPVEDEKLEVKVKKAQVDENRTMKAWEWHGKKSMKLVDRPVPKVTESRVISSLVVLLVDLLCRTQLSASPWLQSAARICTCT